jgi:hypothetical protein
MPTVIFHKQVNLRGVEVDELMVPILEVLWDSGIETTYSCQGVYGLGYIAYRARDFPIIYEVLPRLVVPEVWEFDDALPNRPGGVQWSVRFPALGSDNG